jgi:organic radical activating enzyme
MHINVQPIEKLNDSDGQVLNVHSVFDTIQGEGPFTGHRAVFVRLAGCNLQCPGCDTNYTSDRKTVHVLDLVSMVKEMRKSPHLVVITGGEPFRQNITPFVNALGSLGYTVQIETNGTLAPSRGFPRWPTIVCSPKAGKINTLLGQRANYFKYVLAHDSVDSEDGLPTLALGHSAAPRVARPPLTYNARVYLQPMDPQNEKEYRRNVQAVVASCMKFGHILQLQTHKIIEVA